jgi:hypothetical protein
MSKHFHHARDGRGARRVTVNGNEVAFAIWADVKRGAVCYCPQPLRMMRNGEIYTRTLRGSVVVEPVGGSDGLA